MNITLENYEAFYLDYLEGNLSKQDSAALELFLVDHPHLVLDDTDLPAFSSDENELDAAKKAILFKGIYDGISYNETLIIGEIEGVNTPMESQYLSDLLQKEPTLSSTFAAYQKTHLQPDTTQVFAGKSTLKKRETIVLWPWISAAAASIVLMFSIYNFNREDVNVAQVDDQPKVQDSLAVSSAIESNLVGQKKTVKFQGRNKNNVVDEVQQVQASDVFIAFRSKAQRNLKVVPIYVKTQEISARPIVDKTVAVVDPTIIVDESYLNDLAVNTVPSEVAGNVEIPNNTYVVQPFEKMPNPISGITQIAERLTNTEIDFRKADATKRKSGGLHFKIGKFEYSRRKR
jgi:hypothetical protein